MALFYKPKYRCYHVINMVSKFTIYRKLKHGKVI